MTLSRSLNRSLVVEREAESEGLWLRASVAVSNEAVVDKEVNSNVETTKGVQVVGPGETSSD